MRAPGRPAVTWGLGGLMLVASISAMLDADLAAAIGAYLAARGITAIEAQASSVFLWAYAPVLFFALRRRRPGLDREQVRALLVVMWGIVPVAMVAMLIAGGVGWVAAVAFGNLYHVTATLAGVAGALLWKRRIVGPC